MSAEAINSHLSTENFSDFTELPWVKQLKQELAVSETFISSLAHLFRDWQSGRKDVYLRDLSRYSDRVQLVSAAIEAKLRQSGFDYDDFANAMSADIAALDTVTTDTNAELYKKRHVASWIKKITAKVLLLLRFPSEQDAIGILPITLGKSRELCILKFMPEAHSSFAMVVKEPGPDGKKWFVKTTQKNQLLKELTHSQQLRQAGAKHIQFPAFYIDIPPIGKKIIGEQPSLPMSNKDGETEYDTYAFFPYLDDKNWHNLEAGALQGKAQPPLEKENLVKLVTEFGNEQLTCAQNGYLLLDRLAKNIMVGKDATGTFSWKNVDLGIVWTPKTFSQDGAYELEKVAVNQTFALLWYVLLADAFTSSSVFMSMRELMMASRPIDPYDAIAICMSSEGTYGDEKRKLELTNHLYARLVGTSPEQLSESQEKTAEQLCKQITQLSQDFSWQNLTTTDNISPAKQVLNELNTLLQGSL